MTDILINNYKHGMVWNGNLVNLHIELRSTLSFRNRHMQKFQHLFQQQLMGNCVFVDQTMTFKRHGPPPRGEKNLDFLEFQIYIPDLFVFFFLLPMLYVFKNILKFFNYLYFYYIKNQCKTILLFSITFSSNQYFM